MNKELMKKEEVLPAELQGSWGETVDHEDIILPRILLMQPMSELVSEKELAAPGDIVRSTTEQVIGGREKPVRFFPISLFKTWTVYEIVNGKQEFRRIEPMTSANSGAKLEWSEGGQSFSRDKVLNAYILLEEDFINAQTGSGVCLPCLVSFRRTSYMSGRKLASGIAESHFLKRPGAERTYELRSTKRSNDLGTFYVYDLAPVSKSNNAQIALAKQWFDNLNQVKIHEGTE